MWIFKADIFGRYNQLHWSQESERLMGFILEAGILMIMLTCGFGVGVVEPYRRCYESCDQYGKIDIVFSYVDDYIGAGSKNDAMASQELTHTVIRGVVGYEDLSEK